MSTASTRTPGREPGEPGGRTTVIRRPGAGHRTAPAVPVRRRTWTVPLVPASVREARERAERSLAELGLAPGASVFDAALLVVSELVANAVRHAPRSPDVEVAVTVTDGLLVIAVGDLDPRLPVPFGRTSGQGFRTVTDVARAYAGDLRVEPDPGGRGKTVIVWFALPG
ncbi:ATP-binding protein [Streptomyces luteireticuli]|uniref:ATP-binding protein n=1 Tax=Streptomyces luteireticuli TaxID=173858 RepID=UPI003558176F